MELLSKAIIMAARNHDGQVDKGGNPYILHPLRVMAHVCTVEEKIVAVLHDTLEDTEIMKEDLLDAGFGEEIVEAIACLTRNHNEKYMDFIARCKNNNLARVVKIADLADNIDLTRIKNPTEKDYKRVEKYKIAIKTLKSEETNHE